MIHTMLNFLNVDGLFPKIQHIFNLQKNSKFLETPHITSVQYCEDCSFFHYLFDTSRVYTIVKITLKQNYVQLYVG